MDIAHQNTERFGKVKSFINKCVRVLKITKKPSSEEFKIIVKVSSLGIAVIGLIGFIVAIISTLIKS